MSLAASSHVNGCVVRAALTNALRAARYDAGVQPSAAVAEKNSGCAQRSASDTFWWRVRTRETRTSFTHLVRAKRTREARHERLRPPVGRSSAT